MDDISSITCPSLSESNVEALHAEGIIKLLHFFKFSREIIMRIAGINAARYEVMKNEILNVMRPAPITVNEQCTSLVPLRGVHNSVFIATGIRSLDEALNGGFKGGEIVEIYGMPGSGKTQFCLTVALNCCKQENSLVAYIDTRNDVSGRSFASTSLNENEMKRLRIFKRFDLKGTVLTLSDFNFEMCVGQLNMCPKLRIIIVDSLPLLMYPAVSNEKDSWRFQIEEFMEQIRALANEGILVIIVNHAVTAYTTKWTDTGTNKPSGVKPALGKCWSHQPHFRISMSPAVYNPSKIRLNIEKAPRNFSDEPIFIEDSEIGIK